MNEPTLSIRLVWPFTRLMGDYQAEIDLLRHAGIDADRMADPDLRIPYSVAAELLNISIQKTGDPALGLHAGEHVEPGDFGPMEYAGRSCAVLRDAIVCNVRYLRLLDDEADATLVDEGDLAILRVGSRLLVHHVSAAEFALALAVTLGRRYVGANYGLKEVRFAYAEATNPSEYARFFRAPLRFGASDNALVFERRLLDHPLAHANPDLYQAFSIQAERMLESLPRGAGVAKKVRERVTERIRRGDTGMTSIARELHMSIATLRRKLADEGTSHRQIVDEIRRDLALRHIDNRDLAVTEIAFLLGFSNVNAFSKAFRRWTGTSPLEYRTRRR